MPFSCSAVGPGPAPCCEVLSCAAGWAAAAGWVLSLGLEAVFCASAGNANVTANGSAIRKWVFICVNPPGLALNLLFSPDERYIRGAISANTPFHNQSDCQTRSGTSPFVSMASRRELPASYVGTVIDE